MRNYWLMKSEPDVYSWSMLVKDKSTHWDGVRNYQARNIMRDSMKMGDLVFFYHSNCKPPHIAGIARICKESYPDFTSWDPKSKYYDPKSSEENPRWFMIDIEPISEINTINLHDAKENADLLGLALIRKGQRLSVQPVSSEHFEILCQMGGIKSIPV